MIIFPNCKINIGLNVINKRTDGYHDLETLFFPVPLKDSLEIIQSNELKFQSTGLQINGKEEDNLCVKAYNLLKKDFPELPFVYIHLHKVIPMGAGLGGGSADGAFMLLLLNKKFNLNLTEKQLLDYALLLGSDCPFFILNRPCFATSRGEIHETVDLDLADYKIVLVHPGLHVSTKEAFAQITPHNPVNSIKEIIKQPVELWKYEIINDFEDGVFASHPEIKAIKNELYNKGAVYASMTGTGSTVYGLFEKDKTPELSFPSSYFMFET